MKNDDLIDNIELKRAFHTLWAEALRLNSGAAYEAIHQVKKLLEQAEIKGKQKDKASNINVEN